VFLKRTEFWCFMEKWLNIVSYVICGKYIFV